MKKVIFYSWVLLMGTWVAGPTVSAVMEDAVPAAKDTAIVLNRLLDRAIDGQKGFKEVAEHADSAELKARFVTQSSEREKFAEELKAKVAALGGTPEQGGSFGGTVHRIWIDVKTAVRTDDDKAILGVVKTSEEKTLDTYREASSQDLPNDIRKLVDKQTKEIEKSYQWTVERLKKIENEQ